MFRVSKYFTDGWLGDIENFSNPGDRTAGINCLKNLDMTQTHDRNPDGITPSITLSYE